jgi:hypothetical protein
MMVARRVATLQWESEANWRGRSSAMAGSWIGGASGWPAPELADKVVQVKSSGYYDCAVRASGAPAGWPASCGSGWNWMPAA